MKPQIRYAKTSDGVKIAYTVVGQGVPVVFSFPVSHLIYYWESPVWQSWLEAMAGRFQFVMFDARGNGLSQRGLALTPEAMALDLQAVVEQLGLENFFVFAASGQGHGAVQYAVSHPEQVAGLILWASFVNGESLERIMLVDVASRDWDLFLRSVAQGMNWLEPREVRSYVELLKKCSNQADYLEFFEASLASDIGPLITNMRTPVLVLHPRELDIVPVDLAMELASMLPNAQLVLLEGPRFIPVAELVEPAVNAISEFIEGITGKTEPASDPTPGGFRTVLFTDIVGHTEMMQRLGDAKGRDVLREQERITRETLKSHGGAEVKTMGDGFMASFGSVTSAMDCAIALQRAFAAHTESMPEPLHVRVGLNAGEPIEEDGDLFGSTVILASRIAAKAGAGEILIPEPVRHLLSGKTFVFSDKGEHEMKGFDDAVRLYEVRWRE
jgi:class 3 adenylate cyclase/pimeloyl-ACP methyl ester carboxylesterase